MARYIAVIHNWFMESRGFNVIELDAENEKQADIESCAIAHKQNGDFNRAACLVIAIRDSETVESRKLTWRERLTGRARV